MSKYVAITLGVFAFGFAELLITFSISLGVTSTVSNGMIRSLTAGLAAICIWKSRLTPKQKLDQLRVRNKIQTSRSKRVCQLRVLAVLLWTLYVSRIVYNVVVLETPTLNKMPVYLLLSSVSLLFFFAGSKLSLRRIDDLLLGITIGGSVFCGSIWLVHGEVVKEYGRLLVGQEDNYGLDVGIISANPLIVAYIGASLSLIGIAKALNKPGKWELLLASGLICLGLLSLFSGSSRGATVGALLGGFALIFGQLKRNSIKALGMTFLLAWPVVVGVFYFIQFSGTNLLERIELTSDTNNITRIDIWSVGVKIFLESPFVGSTFEIMDYGVYPHNLLLESLMAVGLLGSWLFMALLGAGIFGVIRCLGKSAAIDSICSVFIVYLVGSFFSGSFYGSMVFWLMLGAILSLQSQCRKEWRVTLRVPRARSKGRH